MNKPKAKPPTEPHAITAAIRFAERAHTETLASTGDPRAAQAAWQACLPELTGRGEVRAYIACIAWGLHARILSADEAKTMLYTAQLALAAHQGANPK